MAMPQHHQFQQQQQPPKPFRNLYNIDGQISSPVAYLDGPNLPVHSQHPPYIPLFHVVGFAPGPFPTADGSDGGVELQWNYGLEPTKKKIKEQDFLENNSQMSSVDFLQARSVSTGLGLSLDNGCLASSGDSSFLGVMGDEIDRELQRQDAEIDRLLKIQVDRLRQEVVEKVQANQLQTISYVEEKVLQTLREKEAEVENINKKNMELELRMEQLAVEAGAWQQRAKYNESMINTLKFNLQQVYAQSKDSKEGCGDSEVDDTASCCNGRAIDFHLLCKQNNERKGLMTCKVCRVNEVCMLLLPCKHLCLCKACESKLSLCPLCQSSKFMGLEVYM
ncbi:putative BOI-related E3 ubiquitin-protein ligase 3 [Camellia lanceoleosa]|uniref:BOI-related E3 ubiquitin-protein ligase 3 n=1 Tax=Camellia lanceoleosa TaxID=1840588 RepID=A0ACC0HLR3_9ERIC|nr:putative BOI-related E3 ubiquitin-protein ligase 3 [Camellia lanceoleosa]